MYAQQEDSRTKIAKISSRLLRAALVAGAFFASNCQKADAQLFYDFVDDWTGEVLATLELTSLPATHAEVAGLTFTPAGEAIYGYGSTYAGTFDSTFDDRGSVPERPVSEIKPGYLGCLGCQHTNIQDRVDIPPNAFYEEPTGPINEFFPQGTEALSLEFGNLESVNNGWSSGFIAILRNGIAFGGSGLWVAAVPEPSSMLMAACALCFGISARRRDRG